jgi:hypothetical protein
LVHDCFDEYPAIAVGSAELKALTTSAAEEADLRCCDPVDEIYTDKIFVARYSEI